MFGRKDWRLTLRQEFAEAEEGFITRLKRDYVWDVAAFQEMVLAMREACRLCAEDEDLERWMALGFFYVPAFVRAWALQENFPRPDLDYWQRAIDVLEELSHWYFWGEPVNGDIDPSWRKPVS